MSKDSQKPVVESGEGVLGKVARDSTSNRRQSLRSRWEDVIWVGVAKKSNKNTVVLENVGPAIRRRTVKRRTLESRRDA